MANVGIWPVSLFLYNFSATNKKKIISFIFKVEKLLGYRLVYKLDLLSYHLIYFSQREPPTIGNSSKPRFVAKLAEVKFFGGFFSTSDKQSIFK